MNRRAPAACAWALGLLAGSLIWPQGGAAAVELRAERQRSEPGTLMSERAYRRFDSLTTLYGDGRYPEALSAVEAYLRTELNDYERAMGEQLAGYVLVAMDRLAEAVARFEQAIRLDALPNNAHFGLMRALAQVYAALERWQDSIAMMEEYLSYRPEATPEDRIMMGQSFAQLGRYREALPWVRAAIEGAGDRAQESWYQLKLGILFELGDHRAALEVLGAMVARWPRQLSYWEMMAGAHQELGEYQQALAALMAAYNAGLITEQARLLNLARLSLTVDLPFQAGQILSRAMGAGQVQRNQDNLRLLLEAWTAAREFERAAEVIDHLAPMAADGELLMRKARLMMEQNRWAATVTAAREALELGRLERPGQAWLLIGIAYMELDELQQARDALQRAQQYDPDSRRQAREWQRFVEERMQVAKLRSGR